MSTKPSSVVAQNEPEPGSVKGYVIGYVLALIITITAYTIVKSHGSSRVFLFVSVAVLAFTQFIVQLLFFLHLGRETRPRWKLAVFFGMLVVVLILVGGSLWIMHNLNYRMLPSQSQVNTYMNNQGGGL